MPQTTKTDRAPSGTFSYNGNMLLQLMTQHAVKAKDIRALFGQSNPNTVKNWTSGSDIYIKALIAICNAFDFDPLKFVSYAGYTFQSSLSDLYRLESIGLTVEDILKEHGVVWDYEENKVSQAPKSEEDIKRMEEARREVNRKIQSQHTTKKNNEPAPSINASTEIINKIIDIQQKAFEHEQTALEALRKQKDAEIAARDQTILNLKVLLARMGYQGYVADGTGQQVADDGGGDK